MKKTIKMLCVAAIALFAIPQHADAQLFKKLGEAAVDAAAEVVKETIVGETPDNASNVNIETSASGVGIGNPGAQYFDLEFIEAIGNTSGNTVTIYVKATAKDLNYTNVHIGDNNVIGYDNDGNEYKSNDSAPTKNLPAGLPVKFQLSALPNVPAKVTTLPVVYSGWYISSDKSSRSGNLGTYIQFKNVPVKWQ